MIFLVTYKNDIKGVFFTIWNAQQYISFFTKEEQEQMKIERINEQNVTKLQRLKDFLQKCDKINTHNNHCCGNCGRTFWNQGILICDFNKEEVHSNDYCIHYL